MDRTHFDKLCYKLGHVSCSVLGWDRLAAQAAARLATASLKPRRHEGRTILISGLGRVGKTILAKELRAKYNYKMLTTDSFLNYFFPIASDAKRQKFRNLFYNDIVKRWPRGLVIEGDDFILKNRKQMAQIDHELDLTCALQICDRFNIPIILLGNSEATVQEKITAFRHFSTTNRCWTTTVFEDSGITIDEYASWLIRVSRELKGMAKPPNVHYIELGTDDFDLSMEETVHKVARIADLDFTRGPSRGKLA